MMKNSSNYLQLLSKWLSLLRVDQQKMKYSEIEKQLSHYLTRKRNPSRKTVEKIERALNDFGKEISQVHFI